MPGCSRTLETMVRLPETTLKTPSGRPASAAPWQSINQRQARIEGRIDQGIRSGALTRREAVNLRTEFRGLVRADSHRLGTQGQRSASAHRVARIDAQIEDRELQLVGVGEGGGQIGGRVDAQLDRLAQAEAQQRVVGALGEHLLQSFEHGALLVGGDPAGRPSSSNDHFSSTPSSCGLLQVSSSMRRRVITALPPCRLTIGSRSSFSVQPLEVTQNTA